MIAIKKVPFARYTRENPPVSGDGLSLWLWAQKQGQEPVRLDVYKPGRFQRDMGVPRFKIDLADGRHLLIYSVKKTLVSRIEHGTPISGNGNTFEFFWDKPYDLNPENFALDEPIKEAA